MRHNKQVWMVGVWCCHATSATAVLSVYMACETFTVVCATSVLGVRRQLCGLIVQTAELQHICPKLGNVRRQLSFKIRSLLAGLRRLIIVIRLVVGGR